MNNRIGAVTAPHEVILENRKIKPLGDNDVLIKIVSSSICGSDLHIFEDKHPMVRLPVTVGHELSGTITKTGSNVTKLQIGDRVCLEPVISCGSCNACIEGNYGYCENINFTYRIGDGAMADYITADSKRVYKLPKQISFDAGALIEPLSVAVHAVRRSEVTIGSDVLIMGAGVIGILTAALCQIRGASNIVICDLSDFRLNKALEMGATRGVNPKKENLEELLMNICGRKGVDFAFECVGNSITLNQAIPLVKSNGTLVIVGLFEGHIEIPVNKIVTKELNVKGSQGYCHDFAISLDIAARKIDLEKLITHRYPLEKLKEAFETASDRSLEVIKVIVNP